MTENTIDLNDFNPDFNEEDIENFENFDFH